MSDKENIHAGHRQRLMKTIEDGGFETLSLIQQVEALLFDVIPRVDTNPIAHRLIDKFKYFHAIIDASIEDLVSVKGIGIKTAQYIKKYRNFIFLYEKSKAESNIEIRTIGDLHLIVKNYLRFKDREETILISLNHAGVCNGVRKVAIGSDSTVEFELRMNVIPVINSLNSNRIVLAHNHPGGFCKPSTSDIVNFKHIQQVINGIGCELYDSMILGIDGIYSLKQDKKVFNF